MSIFNMGLDSEKFNKLVYNIICNQPGEKERCERLTRIYSKSLESLQHNLFMFKPIILDMLDLNENCISLINRKAKPVNFPEKYFNGLMEVTNETKKIDGLLKLTDKKTFRVYDSNINKFQLEIHPVASSLITAPNCKINPFRYWW